MEAAVNAVSANYRRLSPSEVDTIADQCVEAWKDPQLPMRQYELAVKPELEAYHRGLPSAPFDALVKCLRKLPLGFLESKPRLLDVGASAGYYSEVLRLAGFDFRYTGLDYSEAFKSLAEKLYPGIEFEIGDARYLRFKFTEDAFDIVLTGGTLMHIAEYKQVIAEVARVASNYVLLHRTPVVIGRPTEYFEKEAYGVKCLEIHFNERDLLDECSKHGMELIHSQNIFWNVDEGMGHWSYLLRKQPAMERQWERA